MDTHTWLTIISAILSSIMSTVATVAVIKTDVRWIIERQKEQADRIEKVETRLTNHIEGPQHA